MNFAEKGIKPVYEMLHWALDQFVITYGEASAFFDLDLVTC